MTFNRRRFLKTSLASGTGLISHNLFMNAAQAAVRPNDFKTLIYVHLLGGNDGFNMLAPTSTAEYNAYKAARQDLAFDRNDFHAISPNGYAANSFGVHPDMQGVAQLFSDGVLSFISGIGPLIEPVTKADITQGAPIPFLLGSHSTQEAYWKTGHTNENGTTRDGIGGRIADELINSSNDLPINLTVGDRVDIFNSQNSGSTYNVRTSGLNKVLEYDLSNSGYNSTRNTVIRDTNDTIMSLAANESHILLQHMGNLYLEGFSLNTNIQSGLENIGSFKVAFRNPLNNPFKAAAEMVSIRERLGMNRQVITLTIPGFDTHAEHLDNHNLLMKNLNDDLVSFNAAMAELNKQNSVTLVTGSEFGRTLSSTGDGTDHAWGNNQIIMGGAVKAQQLFGSYPSLELGGADDMRNDGRLIPTTSVDQLSATLARWMSVPENRIEVISPLLKNFSVKDLGLFS